MISSPFLAAASFLVKPIFGGIGHILMYHRVVEVLPCKKSMGARIEIEKSHFIKQLDFFRKRNYKFLSLDALYSNLTAAKPNSHFVCLTFDDGYKDNLEIAYPILKDRNIPFCIYVTTDFPEQKAVLWWYLFEELFSKNKRISIRGDNNKIEFDCTSPLQQEQTELTLRKLIKKCPPQELDLLLHTVFSQNGVDLFQKTKELALTWDEIFVLSTDPLVTIGAHSMHHHALNNLSNDDLISELALSRNLIEKQTKKTVNHFAYPYGSKFEVGEREFNFTTDAGYKTAVTSRMANIFPKHKQHLTALPRLEMPIFENDHALQIAINGLIQAKRYRFQRVVWDN